MDRAPLYRLLLTLARTAEKRGLLRRARTLLQHRAPRLARLLGYVPSLPPAAAWHTNYPAVGPERGRVALFLGCVARDLDRATIQATLQVLTRLGYAVEVPADQVCCGAIHLHGGQSEEACRLAVRNLEAFAPLVDMPLISTASGCGATLAEYPQMTGLNPAQRAQAQQFAIRQVDISAFLSSAPWPPGLALRALPEPVAVHDPCSLRNVLRQPEAPYTLLRRIPEIQVIPLPGNGSCCGSAGTYLLTHPATADTLAQEKRDALAATRARILVTSNIGCALHLRASLPTGTTVLHPVTLLAQHLEG